MGKHRVPDGEVSSYGQKNGDPSSPGNGRHAAQETTPMELPARGKDVSHDDWKKK